MANLIKSKPVILLIVLASGLANYLLIDKTQKQPSNNSTKEVQTPQEWLQLYTCSEKERLNRRSINVPFPSECRRDPAAWRYKYIEEHATGGVLIKEESIDERLANAIYTTTTTKWANTDHFKFNSGSRRQDEANRAAVAGPQVDGHKCRQHLQQMNALIEDLEWQLEQRRLTPGFEVSLNESHIRLARVLDSFGRYESGFLVSGVSRSVGSYEDCTKRDLLFRPPGGMGQEATVKTRYCWARLKADEHLDESLKSRGKTSFDDQDNSVLTGICIPETCHSVSFAGNKQLLQRIVDSQFRLPKSMFINETLELESIFCLPDAGGDFSMPLAGRLLLAALTAWVGLALYATLRHNPDPQAKLERNKWMNALDLVESWRDFVETNRNSLGHIRQKRPVELPTLDGIKVFLCICIVLSHSYLVAWTYSSDYLKTSYAWDTADFRAGFTMFGTYVVDTFFVLSGLVVSYSRFKVLAKRLSSTDGTDWKSRAKCLASFCFTFTHNRYLRLVPMFAMVHWFKKFVLLYLGWGPLWDFGFNRDTSNGACRQEESWLVPFTFWSAHLPLTKQCLIQSWSVSNDIFFSLLLGPFMVAMYFLRLNRALWTTLLVSLVSMVAYNWELAFKMKPELHYELQDIGHLVEMRYMTIASHLYTRPLYRLASISFGVLGGYYLFKFGDQMSDKDRFTRALRGPLSTWSQVAISLPFLVKVSIPSLRLFIAPYQSLIQFMLPLLRMLWAVSKFSMLVRLSTDWKETTIARLLSGRVFRVLCKLNYSILLLHYDLLLVNYYSFATTTVKYSNWLVFATASYVYLLAIPLSALMYVVFENPINKLIRTYI